MPAPSPPPDPPDDVPPDDLPPPDGGPPPSDYGPSDELPHDPTASRAATEDETEAQDGASPRRVVELLGFLAICDAALLAAISRFGLTTRIDDYSLAVLGGLLVGQLAVLGFWAGAGSPPLSIRLPAAFSIPGLALVLCVSLSGDSLFVNLESAAPACLLLLGYSVLFGMLAWLTGRRLYLPPFDWQRISVRHLLALMAVAGLTTWAIRTLAVRHFDLAELQAYVERTLHLTAVASPLIGTGVLAAIAATGPPGRLAWWSACAAHCLAAPTLHFLVLQQALGPPAANMWTRFARDSLFFLFTFHVSEMMVVASILTALVGWGADFRRPPEPEPEPPQDLTGSEQSPEMPGWDVESS